MDRVRAYMRLFRRMQSSTRDGILKNAIVRDVYDDEVWRTTEEGKHYAVETGTGAVTKGKIGTKSVSSTASWTSPKESGSEAEENSLEDLFGDLWNESPEETKAREKQEKEKRDRDRERLDYGQNGLNESEYPDDLRLTGSERDIVNNVLRSYRDDDFKSSDDLRDISQALNGLENAQSLEAKKKQYQQQMKQAEEMIEQRKGEGYHGLSRKESWEKWQRLKGEIAGTTEHERGDYLRNAAIGEKGIGYWQHMRKDAERKLKHADLAVKIAKRNDFAKRSDHYMPWRSNPNAQEASYAPWKTHDSGEVVRTMHRNDLRYIGLLKKFHTKALPTASRIRRIIILDAINTDIEDGGPGSGNWGHRGRPGLVGGSGKGGGAQYRGGRSDIKYHGSKHDWLNGLQGERQHEVTTWLKGKQAQYPNDGDEKKPIEQRIMEQGNWIDKAALVQNMAEARKWDEYADRMISENLNKEDIMLLSALNSKYGYDPNTGFPDASDIGSWDGGDLDCMLDLKSKAMGGQVSGKAPPDELMYEAGLKERPKPAPAQNVASQGTQTQQNVVQSGQAQRAAFVPAKSLPEAEAYADKYAYFVRYNGKMSLDTANKVNCELDVLSAIYPADKLTSIQQNGHISAVAQASWHTIEINGKKIQEPPVDYPQRKKDAKAFLDKYAKLSPAVQRHYQKDKKLCETILKCDRHGVSDTSSNPVGNTIAHEYAHVLADQYFGHFNGSRACKNANTAACIDARKMVLDTYNKAMANGDAYKLSEYATTDEYEFLSEAFAAKWEGETLPKYISDMIEGVFGHGKL